ncbi:MAG: hypothetical protein M1839_001373 [Geoglossum umbratile]|nr:MAG: hypothetical protein M1839_001373 [Geoglossum umbratile]
MDSSTGRPVFSLQGKNLKLNEKSDIEPHLSALRAGRETVVEVRLSGNTLGVGPSEALAEVLKELKNLEDINIADIFTGRLLSEIPPALTHILEALVTLPKLHTINLSDNAFGLNTQAPLVAFLSAHTPLRKLILNNNGLGPRAGKLIAEALTKLAAKKEEARKAGQDVPNLEAIVCGRNRLENGSMAAWTQAFAAHSGVKEVKMTQNGIRPEGIEILLRQGLKHATGLQVLDLEDNTFTLRGATALADVVLDWHHITDLGVNDCLLGKPGAVLLAKALQKGSKTLETLRLAFNDVDLRGLNELQLAIVADESPLPKLKRIELNGNRFSEDENAVAAIREYLLERVGGAEGHEPVMDDLEDMDEESSEEDEEPEGEPAEEDEDDEDKEDLVEQKAEKAVKDAEKAEDEPVPAQNDKTVDDLTARLEGTAISSTS